jgi:hypothetical protein
LKTDIVQGLHSYVCVFVEVVKTDGLKCPEMREGRAWRHHIDYYGIAATAYLLLFGTYMEVIKVSLNTLFLDIRHNMKKGINVSDI